MPRGHFFLNAFPRLSRGFEVTFLLLMRFFRPRLCVMLEQPSSSWLFKQRQFPEVKIRWSLQKFLVHLGFYGHDLLKPSHFMANVDLEPVSTRATKVRKAAFDKRIADKVERQRARGEEPKVYWKRDEDGRFHGGRDLQTAAVYPNRFVLAVFNLWLKHYTAKCSAQWKLGKRPWTGQDLSKFQISFTEIPWVIIIDQFFDNGLGYPWPKPVVARNGKIRWESGFAQLFDGFWWSQVMLIYFETFWTISKYFEYFWIILIYFDDFWWSLMI